MKNTNKSNLYIATSFLLLFVLLSVFSLRNYLVGIDEKIISWFTSNTPLLIVSIMEMTTKIGSGEIIILLTIGIGISLIMKKMWGYSILLFSLTFGGILLNFLLKILFQRERPGEMSVIEVFGYSLEISSYSFPSGHTMRSVILFSFLLFLCFQLLKRKNIKNTVSCILVLLMIMVSLSRIIVGAHYPTDILAAITISISWFYYCLTIFNWWVNRKA